MNEPTYFADVAEQVPPTWGEDCVVGAYPVLGVTPIGTIANRRPYRKDWHPGHIGSRTVIGHHCVMGAGVMIGEDCRVGDHVNIREGVVVGSRCVLGTKIDIQFGVVIGDDVKIFNATQITGNSTIGRGVFIGPGVQSMNDLEIAKHDLEDYQHRGQVGITIDDYAFIGGGAIILPGVHIGERATVASGAIVTKDVPAGATVRGEPARITRYKLKLNGNVPSPPADWDITWR